MLKATVGDIMSEHIVKITDKYTVMQAAHLLLRFQINGVLVVRDGKPDDVIGILTTTDLLRLLDKVLSTHGHKIAELDKMAKMIVGDVLSTNVLKMQKDTRLEKAIAIMHRENKHTIPVYDGEKLVGVIGRHDILNAAFYRSTYSS